jgi:hypothetical protein
MRFGIQPSLPTRNLAQYLEPKELRTAARATLPKPEYDNRLPYLAIDLLLATWKPETRITNTFPT